MKNLTKRPLSRFGLPYHGLVTDGVLTTNDGPVSVTHTASVEGARVFKTRNPPGNNPTAGQAALDTARGWDWRDYVILNGWYNSIGEGATQLGELSWLYADLNDVVWQMEIVGSLRGPVSTVYYWDIEVWRRQPFGRYRFGLPDRVIADELLTTLSIAIPEYSYREGGIEYTYLPGIFGNQMSMNSASLVPSVHGDVVHVHVLNNFVKALEGTWSYWNLAFRGVFAITTLTLTGSGALDGDGTGIGASFSGTLRYPDMVDREPDIPGVPATIDPWPINHITTFDTSDCSPPTGPGTCQESCLAQFTHDGISFNSTSDTDGWDYFPGEPNLGNSQVVVFKYHGPSATVDCKETYNRIQFGDYQNYLEGQAGGLGSAEMSSEQTLTAVEDPPGTWYWDPGPVTQVCSAWQAQEAQNSLYNGVGVDVNGNLDTIQLEKLDDVGNRAILGVGTSSDCNCISWQSDDGYPGAIGNFSNRTYTFTEPYTITDADTTAYCKIGQQASLIVFPGMIGYVALHALPNGVDTNYTQVVHRGKLWGIGEDGTLTLITSWGPITEVDLTVRFPWTSVAWEPVTKQFNVQTDGSTLVKYI